MADLVLTPIVDVTIKKLISAIADQINLAVSWKEELRRLKDRLTMIRALLQHAGERQVTNAAVKLWLERLRDVASDADDVLDEVAYENLKRKIEIPNHMRRKVCYFFSLSNPLVFQMKMAKKIKKIIASVGDINKEAQGFGLQPIPVSLGVEHRRGNPQTASFCDVSRVVGRDDEVSRIVELLTDSTNQLPLCVTSIIGMGGLGKTTLAQSVRNNERIIKDFAKIMWVCVSENFDVERILKEMLESLTRRACGDIMNVDSVIQQIRDEVAGKNYLLILDDVWNLDGQKWEGLRSHLLGIGNNSTSRIVVTTRDEGVASIMGTFSEHKHYPRELEDGECLSIIKQRAFGNSPIPPNLEPIGREIAQQCRGLPLVANVIGATLCNSRTRNDWLSIKNQMNVEEDGRILSILKLSFDRLPEPALKQCFAFCSIFPKDYVMERNMLIELWMTKGFILPPEGSSKSMEDIGNQYFNDLLSYSLFQDLKSYRYSDLTCKMHDLIHDLAQSVSKHETVIVDTISEHNIPSIPNHLQHLNLIYSGEMAPAILGDVAQNLHTLFLKLDFSGGIQADLKRLRVLNLCGAGIEELPFCFDNMKSLRFLDISNTKIKVLPNSIGKLYNLQTFRFMCCFSLEMPSEGIGYLINLRHIYFNEEMERYMPTNIGRLTNLQTLPCFWVDTRKGRKIEELGSLSRLKGRRLVIRNLKLVKDKSEAKLAKLHEKAVDMLELLWDDSSEFELEGNHDEEVLEGLRPHPNLQTLEIHYYGGKNLPSWMLSNELFSPNNFNLVELDIQNCAMLKSIPVINGLSSLKRLDIWHCDELTSIADRAFEKMSLEEVFILKCPKLESLGAICLLLGLKELHIGGFSEEAEKSLDFSFIHHNHASLEKLGLYRWETLTELPHQIQHLTALRELRIGYFYKLDALPEWLGKLSSLESLTIESCWNLECLPSAEAIRRLTKLKKLKISDCPGLTKNCTKETGAEWPKISHIPNIYVR